MQQHKRRIRVEARGGIAGWEWKADRFPRWRSEKFGELQISIHRMVASLDTRNVMVEKFRAFASVAQSIDFLRSADFCDKGTAQQPLKVDRNIRADGSSLAPPGQNIGRRAETLEVAPRENVDMIDIGISAQERGPFWIDHPGDLRVGLFFSNCRYRGQSVDDVAE